MLTGVDISKYQHPNGAAIDYETAVHGGISFAIVEYRDEETTPNSHFEADFTGFRKAGAGVGSYVFLRPDLPLGPQANDLRMLSQHGPVWADVEVLDGMRPAEVLKVWDELRAQVPIVQLVTYPAFIGETKIVTPVDELWLDDWGVKDPSRPCAIWGMTSQAHVPGLAAAVDLDAWMLGQARFELAFRTATKAREVKSTIEGMAPYPGGDGYWLVAADGQVYPFGKAAFHGSLYGKHFASPIAGITATPTGAGYWIYCQDGEVHQFGDARFAGSIPLPRRAPKPKAA